MDHSDPSKRHEQKGYHRPRDDRTYREPEKSSQNPFSGRRDDDVDRSNGSRDSRGGYDSNRAGGGQRGYHRGGYSSRDGSSRDGGGYNGDRNGGGYNSNRNGGGYNGDRSGSYNNGGRNGGGYHGNRNSGRSGSGNSDYSERSHDRSQKYDERKYSPDANGGSRNRSMESDRGSTSGVSQFGKRPPEEQGENSRKKLSAGRSVGEGSSSAGRTGDRSGEKSDRPRRDRYQILNTVPANFTTKKGADGELIRLKANFFELVKRPNYEMVMYRVDFDPEIDMAAKRKYLMYTQRNLLGAYLYDTQNSVYLTHRLPQDLITVQAQDRENNAYKMTIKFGTIVSMDTRESLQVLNLILRRAMEGLKLQLIGRNLFDPRGKVDFRNYQLQLWPGYTTSIRQHEQNVLLCAEIASKIMRNETIYDVLKECSRGGDFQTQFNDAVLGMVVLTDYNNKTYRVDDVNHKASPSDTFETKTGPITYIEYYKRKYNITIRNPTQPMLITRSTERQKRGGQDDMISLVPELCRPTGLTDQQRNNFQLMKAIADHTRMDPRKRMQALNRFNSRLQETEESQEIFRQWNLGLSRNLVEIEGKKLKNESIIYGEGVKEPTQYNADWQMAFKDKSMFLSYPLRNWCILVTRRMRGDMQRFIDMMQRASRQMRFEVAPPHIIEVEDRAQSYLQGMEEAARNDPQLIMTFVSNNNADRYASIKKSGCCTYGIPTQVVTQKSLNNQRSLMSIATKVAIQLNCKLGGTPWLVPIPSSAVMTIGIDVSRDNKDKNVSWGALVASMDLKNIERESFFSCVSRYSKNEEFSTQLAIDITKAITAYEAHHQSYPEKIVIYRDGVGDGQLEFVYQTELAQIKSRLEEIYNKRNLKLRMVFIIVSKKVNTRIFGRDEKNPPPGTVVDDVITQPEKYDFYMIPQTVRQGTVSPTSYNVIYDSWILPPGRLQLLTYKQCHLYYNWAGTVRVPAVCQYAHKLTFLVAQSLHQVPLPQLEKKLYFL